MRCASECLLIPVGDIKPYDNNARINDHVVKSLKESIVRFGFNSPIVLSDDNVIICGHTRLKAALELGIDKVPCVYAKGLTDAEIKAYRLADNKIGELAVWDMGKLEKELSEIGSLIDMQDFGFLDGNDPVAPGGNDPVIGGVDPDNDDDGAEPKKMLHRCPHCGEVFED